jgi:hypothetical protein
VAVPDLTLDTATGKLSDSKGTVLEPALDPAGKLVGHYCVDGYVTSVTRSVGQNVLNMPFAKVDLVKGYVLGDTTTGRVLKQKIYYSQPIGSDDL